MQPKLLPVPPDMAGSRADSGIAKMLGISRSHVAELIAAGAVSQNGTPVAKSDRLVADAVLEVILEEVSREISVQPEDVEALKIIFQDEHIVVIDKPSGVVSHPSQGFVGPSVPGVLMARGIQLSTSGAQERQGIVQRLDVGTSGLMVLAKSEMSYSVLKQAFR
ncbi:MAG: RluA family pseudouridine synthase, partial [Aquiluna sp.]